MKIGKNVMRTALGRRLFGTMLLVSMAGCAAPVEVKGSNRDPAYQGKITRVLVTTELRAPGLKATQNEGFVRAFEIRESLAAAWGPLGVSFIVVDLADGQGAAEVAQFAPQQLLALTLKGHRLYSYVVDAYDVDASLTDVSTKRRVWRGSMRFNGMQESGRMRHSGLGGAISHQNDANDLVQALTAKLKSDGLL
jgi:hypothetical protein